MTALDERLAQAIGRLAPSIEERFLTGQPDLAGPRILGETGLLGVTIPPSYGGLGHDYLALGRVCEALGRLDLSYQITITVHLALTAMAILQWGTPKQRKEWLPALTSGDHIATFALTEPGAGSDVAALTTRAVPDTEGFRLSGEKTWISGANDSSVILVFAKTDPASRHHGITAFLVLRDSAGLTTPRLHGKLGIRAGDTGSVVLDNVTVPHENIIGNTGEGLAVALSALACGLFTVGYGALGIISECLALTTSFVRKHDSATLLHPDQQCRKLIAGMVSYEARSRSLLDRAANLKNRGEPSQQATRLAKLVAARGAVESAEAALAVHQRMCPAEYPAIQRHLQNAKGAVIYGGTEQVHQLMQATYATGDRIERPFRRPPPNARQLAGLASLP